MQYNNPPTCSQLNESMNNQLLNRQFPSQPLQPYLNIRPVMTKYAVMPIVDPRATPPVTAMQVLPAYNSEAVFNPGTRNAPWSGFVANVNLESELRNQVFALQHCDQRVYVPSSSSDLYTLNYKPNINTSKSLRIDPQSEQSMRPEAQLFVEEKQASFNPNTYKTCTHIFNNSSRVDIKNLTGKQFCVE